MVARAIPGIPVVAAVTRWAVAWMAAPTVARAAADITGWVVARVAEFAWSPAPVVARVAGFPWSAAPAGVRVLR